jgi:hypothetical protein
MSKLRPEHALLAARLCALLPLGGGAAIFLLWLFLRDDVWQMAGFFTLLAGCGLFLLGAGSLLAYVSLMAWAERVDRRRVIWQTIGTAALLLVNFPVAAGILTAVEAIESRYTVTVTNESDIPLQAARLQGGGIDIDLGDIAPGASVRRGFWIEADGELRLVSRLGSREFSESVDGYVTGGIGADMAVTVRPDGTVAVTDLRHPDGRD